MKAECVMFQSNGKIITLHIYEHNEHISNTIREDKDFYESKALAYVREKVPMYNRVVLDIGANIGNHSVFFSTICGAKVLAFEPNNKNYEMLTYNSMNKSIIPLCMLIGDNDLYDCNEVDVSNMGAIKFTKAENGACAIPIDALNVNDVALIKIDVEGMELEVLSGAMQTIQRCNPAIMVEVDNNKPAIIAILTKLGYNTHKLNCHSNTILAVKDK